MEKLASLVTNTLVHDLVVQLGRAHPNVVPALTTIFAKIAPQIQHGPSTSGTSTAADITSSLEYAGQVLQSLAPPLDDTRHKGQNGRIGVLGGSIDYTGAPFYTVTGATFVYCCWYEYCALIWSCCVCVFRE